MTTLNTVFKQKSNTMLNNGLFSWHTVGAMHETMKRLYAAAELLKQVTGQSAVARLLNASPQTVKNWEARGVSKQGMLDAEQLIGCRSSWVRTGDGDMADLSPSSDTQASLNGTESNAEDGPQLRKPALVPVVGEVKAGTDGYLEELQYPVGHGDEYAPSPVSDSSAYAVRVRGESMYPRYKSGEYVIISPSLIAQNGDDVVVIFRDGRKMLKVFGWSRGGEIQLLSINNGFAPLTVNTSELHSMHVVAGTAHRSSIQRLDNQEAEKIDIEERRAIELMKDPRVQELLRDIEQKNK